ncbi:alkaline phosphatase D family protein [Brevundimonas sp.]|jgi:alkaline phosphatase D|uniref:alkaline phosphatase D family protein n=1 Tax=Brevundimonas sp. TaxID=1871086 RepID=UPI002E118F44|nr:alkaline phosphatase D family protein [Brevundimonas sp.]
MAELHRRGLLGLLAAGSTVPTAASAQPAPAFLHGVASGDPLADRVVLWTRVTTDAPVQVDWRIWPWGQARPARPTGRVTAGAERDFTVKIDAADLQPGRDYAFDFAVGDVVSSVGRCRTLPVGPTEDVVVAVASCQLHPGGLFNAYAAIAELERLDAVIHLGDYIYEYGAGPGDYGMATGAALSRIPQPPHEIVTLADYRLRHAQYKSDPDLQAAHARAAFICVWDDHEVTNDGWLSGAENHQPDTEGDWATRKAAAIRAYAEWMPIREPQGGLTDAIYRSFRFGDLMALHMVETRLTARAEQLDYARDMGVVDGAPDLAGFEAKRNDPSRDLLGEPQRAWLSETLNRHRDAAWQVIGNQVVMARVAGPDVTAVASPQQIEAALSSLPAEVADGLRKVIPLFKAGLPFNLDSWDGYPVARERLYAQFAQAGVQPIVLAGDSHAFWVNELKDASGARRGAEFGTSSISSPSPGDAVGAIPLGPLLDQANPEVVHCDQKAKGFLTLTVTRDAATAELIAVSTLFAKPFETRSLGRWRVEKTAEGITAPMRVRT